MAGRKLKRVDVLRHELKALRFILDNYHAGKIAPAALPPRDDFLSPAAREIFDLILAAPTRSAAEARIAAADLEQVDLEAFLRLSGEHYYSYPALVRERAAAVRRGALEVENA